MRLRSLLFVALLPRLATAQSTDTIPRRTGATVSGIVRDSIGRVPLPGAIVQIVAADDIARFGRSARSDSLGRFTLGDVPIGRYTLGFFHPFLDSLGVEAPLRELNIGSFDPVRTELAIPSPVRLRAALCGQQPPGDSGAVVVGLVRYARDDSPAAAATVTAQWREVSLGRRTLVHRTPHIVAIAGEKGWFAVCNVPSRGAVALIASRGADSTDLIELQLSARPFLRNDLYLGPQQRVAVADTMPRADSLAPRPRAKRTGDGYLTGTVYTAADLRPLHNALVSITGGPETRTNERGEWTLANAPMGTRMLEVRAIGYYPERRQVTIVAGAPAVHVSLSTLKSVLDTVKVRTSRYAQRDGAGFEQRRRSGAGRYLTADDLARMRLRLASEIFARLPGIHLAINPDTHDKIIVMRGCAPTIFLNGHQLNHFTAEDLDDWAHAEDVVGIEMYSGATMPPEFQPVTVGLSVEAMGCGSIVIWTK